MCYAGKYGSSKGYVGLASIVILSLQVLLTDMNSTIFQGRNSWFASILSFMSVLQYENISTKRNGD